MVRPLLEIQRPWLTREQAEAGIWRLTGTKNPQVVEQLLRIMDIYAVSQGPALTLKLKERDRARDRWKIELPVYDALDRERNRPRLIKELAEDKDDSVQPKLESDIQGIRIEPPERPLKASPVWKMPDGSFEQLCLGECGKRKPYDDFYKDVHRWNGRASQCRLCRSAAKRNPIPRKSTTDRIAVISRELLRDKVAS